MVEPSALQADRSSSAGWLVSLVACPVAASGVTFQRSPRQEKTISVPSVRRRVKVTDRRTRRDWAELMRELVDEHYSEAEVITLVLDNLNTHKAYAGFRSLRAKARKAGKPADSLAMAGTLIKYSERGEDYIAAIRNHIAANRLQQLDKAALDE